MVDPLIIGAIVVGALSAASYYQQRKMQRQAEKQANEMASHQISGHDSNRALYTVYGRALIGTTTIYKRVSRRNIPMANANFTNFVGGGGSPSTESKTYGLNRFLYRISSLSNGPINGIENVLIDGEKYTANRFTAGHTKHFEAAVSLGPTAGNHFANLRTSYATDFSAWGADKKGQGVAYVVERFWFDKSNPAYQGEPSTQYLVKGRSLYDPRLDSTVTGGSGSHRSDTPSTWAFSDNPALALLDMLTNDEYGRGVSHADCNMATFITAANKCDTLVDIPARATNTTGATMVVYDPHTGTTYEIPDNGTISNYRIDQVTTGSNANKQKRFRLNMAVDNSKEVLDNIQQILQSFRGNLHHINGEYVVHMDDVASPVLTLTDDDIIGGLKIAQGDRKQRINRMTVKFLNANKHYKTDQVSWPPIDSDASSQYQTYLTADSGEKLHKTVTLTGCTDYYQAEDIAEYLVRESRVTLAVNGTFGSRCFNLVPGDVISLTYDSAGYSGKYFIVDQVGVDVSSMNVKLSLREYDSSVYTWNVNRGNEPIALFFDEEQQYNASPTSPTFGTIDADSIALSDGTTALRLSVPFSGIPEEAASVEVAWSVQNANVFTNQVILDEDATKAEFLIGIDNQVIDLRIRYFVANADGIQLPSGYTTTTFTLPAVSGTKLDNIEDNATRNQVFQQDAQPSGGAYQTGDIWIDTNDNFKMYMYDSGAWVLRADSRIATALADAAGAQSTADGKIDTFYQNDEPSSASLGDLWIDTNDDNKLYRHDGTNFQAARDSGIAEAIQDAATAQSTADGKITTFFAASTATPTAEGVGDMWYQTDNAVMQRWNGSTWNDVASYNTGDLADRDTVGNAQIDDDAVATENIITGATDEINPVSQSGNIYRWAGYDGAGNVVNAIPSGVTVEYDATENALEMTNDGNVALRSDSFEIDHSAIYAVKVRIKRTVPTTGLFYIGAYQHTAFVRGHVTDGGNAQTQVNFTQYRAADRFQSVSTNAYFYSASGSSSYQDYTFFLMGANVDIDDVPLTNVTSGNAYLQASSTCTHVGLRILNWGNGGTTNTTFFKDFAVTKFPATTIHASNLNVANLSAITSNLGDIDAGSIDINSAFTVSSTGVMTATSATVTGSITATSLTLQNTSIAESQLATGVQDSLGLADSAIQDGDTSVNLGLDDGSIAGISIDATKLYAGTGDWANTNTGFYLDNSGKFSLKDKMFFNPSNNTLTVDGNITADIITAKENLIVLGDLEASSMAAGSITRAMFSQDALDEIYSQLATSIGGSNGDYKEASGNFTGSGGTVTVGTSSDKFEHGASSVDVEFLANHYFYATTNYTTAQAQATLNFEVSADGTFTDYTSATKTHTLQFGEYDLSSYYGYTYLVYFFNSDVTKTFTTGTGNDIPDNTDLQFRVRVTGVGSAFTGQTVPFTVEANEGVTGVVSTGGNADTLDNLDSTAFLRSNVDDTFDGNLTVTGDLSLTGNFNITGDINSHNVTDLDVTDRTITVNAGGSAATSDGAGLIVDRGTATKPKVSWDETNDEFDINFPVHVTVSDDAEALILERAPHSTDQVSMRFTANTTRYLGKGTDDNPYWSSALDITSQGDRIWTSADFANNSSNWNTAYGDKVDSVAFNTGDGVLTLTRQDGGTLTTDFDGRYLYTSIANVVTTPVTIKTQSPTVTNTLLHLNANDQYSDIIQSDDGGSTVLRNDQGGFKLYVNGDANSTSTSNVVLALSVADDKEARFYGDALFDKNVVIDTATGTNKFQINRTGTTTDHNQALRVHVDDSDVVFDSQQDETSRFGGYLWTSTNATNTRNRMRLEHTTGDFILYNDSSAAKLIWDTDVQRLGINEIAPSYTLDVLGDIRGVGKLRVHQAGNGSNNNESAVASLSGQASGTVLNALSLVNSVTAASGNATQLSFHNANGYAPTGVIKVTQAGSHVTDSKLELQIYNSGLQNGLLIDHNQDVTFYGQLLGVEALQFDGTTPASTTNKLYRISNDLNWNGQVVNVEYTNLGVGNGDHDTHHWNKVHAAYSDNNAAPNYIRLDTNVPQDNYSMGGFTLIAYNKYNDDIEGDVITIYGYWNPESNGGFIGFRYYTSNPDFNPTIEVGRNTSGKTVFLISGETTNYYQLVAKNCWFGFSANSADKSWGDDWEFSEQSDKSGVTNLNTLARRGLARSDMTNWTAAYNNSITGVSFNTGTGVLTLSQQDSTTLTTSLDGRYLTAEADTLATVTGRGATTTDAISTGGLTSSGTISIIKSTPVQVMRDTKTTATGAGVSTWVSFQDKNSSEQGWVGFGSTSNTDFGVYNNLGRVHIGATHLSAANHIETPVFKATTSGTAGAPAYTFSTDTNLGMYRYAEDVLSLAAGGYNTLMIGAGYLAQGYKTYNHPISSGGWKKLAKIDSRGGGRLILSYTGGSFTPTTYVIDYYKNWSSGGTLKLERYGSNAHVTAVRIRQDSSDNIYYLEINLATTTSATNVNVYDQRLTGYNATTTLLITGSNNPLSAGSSSGTTISEQTFIEGMTLKNLRVSNAIGIGAAPQSGYTLTVAGSAVLSSGSLFAFGNLEAGNGYVKASSNSPSAGGFYVGSNQVIDGDRNVDVATIDSTKITSVNTSQHTTGTIGPQHAHIDLYNAWESDTDEKGSIITFSDNYYDGANYNKTGRAAIKGGTDQTGNTAAGFLAFYTDSSSANTANERMRIDKSGNFDFHDGVFSNVGNLTSSGTITADGFVAGGIERIDSDGDMAARNLTVSGNFTMTTGSISVNGNLTAANGYVQAGTSSGNGFWVGSNQIVVGDTRNIQNVGSVSASGGYFTSTADRALNATASSAYLQVGPNNGGASGVFGAHREGPSSSSLDYTTYIAYDCYYQDSTNKWYANRTTLGRKWKTNFGGYHQNKFTISVYDGGGTSGSSLSAGWLESDWEEKFSVDSAGVAQALSLVSKGTLSVEHDGITSGDLVSLYQNRFDSTTMYGFGVESGTLYYKANTRHQFYCADNYDNSSWVFKVESTYTDFNQPIKIANSTLVDTSKNITAEAITANDKLNVRYAGTGSNNSESPVASLSGQNQGGTLNALSLVNSVNGALGNAVQIAFHNANNWSPTGMITVTQAGSHATHSKISFQIYDSGLVTAAEFEYDKSATFYGTGDFAKSLIVGQATNESMDSSSTGKLQIRGSGYTGAITLDGTNMSLYHNSSSRGLVLGTNETARITITGAGHTTVHGAMTVNATLGATYINSYSSGSNNAYVNVDARDGQGGAVFHKFNRNNDESAYKVYAEKWYDGSTYHQIRSAPGGFYFDSAVHTPSLTATGLTIDSGTGTGSTSTLTFNNYADTAALKSTYTNPSSTTETYLAFHTNNAGEANGTNSESMRLAGPDLGINVTDPEGRLHVDGKVIFRTNTNADPLTIRRSTGDNQSLRIGVDDSNAVFKSEQDETGRYGGFHFIGVHNSAERLRFNIEAATGHVYTYNDAGTAKMQWDAANERLSINALNPSYTLDVNGTINATSDIAVNGTARITSSGGLVGTSLTLTGSFSQTSGSISAHEHLIAANGYVKAGTSSGDGFWVGSNQIVVGDTRKVKNVNGVIGDGSFVTEGSDSVYGVVRVVNPTGADMYQRTATVTGAIKITLPVTWTSTMMSMTIQVYEYGANESFTVRVGGYNYMSNSAWLNTHASITGSSSIDRNYTVRFGHDGSKCCIYIGETTSQWTYPQVAVTEFMGGFYNANTSYWSDGWDVGIATSFGTITATQTNTQTQIYTPRLSIGSDEVITTGRALTNITGLDMRSTSTATVDLNQSGWITFYSNGSANHAIGSRNNVGSAADDLRINSYGAVYVNLDSNGNDSNQTHSSFVIGRHGGSTSTIANLFKVNGETADVTTSGNITAYGSPSDIRLKENVEIIQEPLAKVKKLDGITFNYKKDGSRSTGLVAQQLLEVLPEVVYETEDLQTEESHYAVRYGQVAGLLVECVKALTDKTEQQQSTIESLIQRIEELENGNN